jgi:plastocyanin
MRLRRLTIALALVALVGVACGGDDTSATGDAGTGDTGGGTATLTAANFAFDPSSLTAAAGDSIEFSNEDDTEHNFTVEDLGIDEDADPGGSTTIDLSSAEPGTYDFFCEYHKDTMTGTLEVTG